MLRAILSSVLMERIPHGINQTCFITLSMSKSKINNLMGVYFSLLFFLVSFVGFSQTTFDFESSNSGFSSKAFSHTNGGYTLDVTSLSQNLVSGSAYFVVVSGSESVINDYSMAPETSTTFALSGGLTFDLVSLKVADVSDAGESLTFTTDKGTASFSVSPETSLAAVTLSASGNPDESNLQGITYFTITSVNGYIFGFDDVVLNNISSGDTSPPSVSSITLSGSPAASASSVTYVVVFDENVSGVSADDFQVTQVSGDAAGSVTGVSGSGSTYNVTVGSISGTGAIRLDLKSNTNITDASGNGNGSNGYVISYTSGGTHTVAMVTPPTVTTTMVNSFTATSATLGGNVTDDGGAEVTDRGVVISTSDTDPEIGDAGVTKDGNGSGTGVFSETIASFSGSTTYYVKAYATNSAGTSYGSVVSFTTDLQISIDDPSETEGTALTFTVSLSGAAPAGGVTVDYTTSDVTAVAGTDYTAASGTLTFAEGESSKTIAVSVTGDDIVEPSETLVVTLSNNTGDSEIPDPTGTGSIVNDDFCSFTISAESVNEDDGTLTFSVTASHDVDGSYSVPINTQNFIASTLDNDYIGITNHMVDFAGNAGESYNVDVTITQDNKIEIDERFRTATGIVTNTSIPSGYFLSGAAFQIIVNDDFAGFTVAESDGTTATSETGTTDDFTVVLDAQPSSNVVITVSSGDTGEGTVDLASLTFTNANWNTPQTVTIDGVDDALLDGDITYSITLSIDDANSDDNFDALEDQTVSVTNADDDAVQISIDDPSETEGTALIFTVSLSGAAPAGGVTVDYSTSDGTAVAGTDYTAASGTLTFAEGESSKEIAVTISGDETVEADETFTITLSNNTGDSEISDATGTGTITNDDQAIVTIADVSADEDDGSVTITLTLDKAVEGGLTLDLSTSDGTATIADGDYTALAGETVTFSGTTGETEEVIITLGSDSKVENNETLTVSMGNLVVSTVASGDIDITGGATVTITNDDFAGFTVAESDGTTATSETGTTDDLTVVLDAQPSSNVVITVSSGDTGEGTVDVASLTFTNANWNTPQTVTIDGVDDALLDGDITYSITLSIDDANSDDNFDALEDQTVSVTNADDDAVQISIDDPSETEGTALTFTVSLSGAAPAGGVTVDYITSDGTAVAGTDYTSASGTLTFAEGESSKEIAVTISGDETVEADETFTITLSNNTGDSEISDATGTGTITNDDQAIVTIADVSADEDDGSVTITLILDKTVDGGLTLDLSTSDGTATIADGDYTALAGETVTFSGTTGETEEVIITLGSDSKVENNETLTVSMGNLVVSTVASGDIDITGGATVTITNDDFAGFTVAESDGTTATSETGTTDDLTVVLDAQPSSNVVITVSSGDTGEGTVDVASLTFTNANWNTPQTVTIDGVDDALLDGDITYSITLSIDDANSDDNFDALEDQTVSVTNADDDAVQISIDDPSETEGTALTFTVSLSGAAPAGGVTVDYITSDGTAVAGTDYTSASGTLTFAEGESSKEIAVTISGDETVEADETFTITLSNNTGDSEISDATGTGTITNDDQAIVTIADVSADEDDGSVTITLTLDKAVEGGLTLDLSTSDGTATIADGDYTALAGETVTFSGTTGETEEVIITLWSDSKVENNETLTVSMGNLVVSTVASGDIDITGGATVTITNDDTARITINDVSGNEDDGPVALTATLDNPVEGGFSVDVNTIDGTATVANSDYTSLADHTLIFAGTAGEAYTFNVSLTSDNKVESNESLTVTLSNLVATVSTSDVIITDQAVIAIINDDNLPVISASQSFDVDENTANGTHVGIVAATDADAGTTFSNWAITDGNGDGIFVINSNTGAITVANNTNLDYEITINYELTLTVSDGTNTSSSETITINVNDLNDNIPIITSAATASVLENSTSVLTIVATDADAGASVVYSISGGDDQTRFSIVSSTGVLTFVVAPDFESPNDAGADNVYQVSVNASDGLYSVSQDIAISVTDQNDNKPVVSIATFNIDQNQDNNTVIGTLTASDADVGTIFQNWVILSDNNNGVFTLNRNTGALSLVNQTLLVDTMVPLLVTVGDGANVSDPAVITINVEIDQETDSDGDGLLDALEDINEDGNINNDDSDGDGLANYLDDDDDGDGLTTRSEDVNQDGDPRNDDSDNDGIPDYLDVESLVAKTKIPQGISPGGDGVNDSWVVPGIESYPDNTVYIYNRWGTLVYEVGGYDNDSKSFKGDSNKGIVGNANLPDGTYFYVIDFGNGAKRKGYLIIKR